MVNEQCLTALEHGTYYAIVIIGLLGILILMNVKRSARERMSASVRLRRLIERQERRL